MGMHNFFIGLGCGLIASFGINYALKPLPIIHIDEPGPEIQGVVSAEVLYDRFQPMPAVMVEGKRVLHYVVERVETQDGQSGLKVIMLVDDARNSSSNWI